MPLPTEAQVIARIRAATRIHRSVRGYNEYNTNPLEALITSLQDLPGSGERADETATTIAQIRASANTLLAQANDLIGPLLIQWVALSVIDEPETDLPTVVRRLRDYFITSGNRIRSRVFVFQAPVAQAGMLGDGTALRVTRDKDGFDIESQTPERKILECIADDASGALRFNEVFEARGESRGRDDMLIRGSGAKEAQITALSTRDAGDWLTNPSFDEPTAGSTISAGSTTLTGWTLTGGGSVVVGETTTFRTGFGVASPRSIRPTGTITLEQIFADNVNNPFSPLVPYYFAVHVRRAAGATGTLVLRVGEQIRSIDISTLTADTWTRVEIQVTGTNGPNAWLDNFNRQNLSFRLECTGFTGNVFLDEIVVGPFTRFDGGWLAIISGATPFRREDEFRFTDTNSDSTRGFIQQHLWLALGEYLPHDISGTDITIADPADTVC